ncbi:unnamed protein product [Adineta ricciae]|uniref:PiggyBac transposable element-derived protein domain-containing protein n=1 Tax=Adineta ricciae TaxID=249248 RepID=A0A815NLJ7_ADIRI|nr:unnamed protein product [Adineta ricciae]
MLCDTNGYILDFIIYTGADTNYKETFSDLFLSSRVVFTLVEDYLDLGYCIIMDSYYSSPKLFLQMIKRKTDAVGTIRSNRIGLPIAFKRIELHKNEQIFRYYKKLMPVKWLDEKYVTMLSTYHNDDVTIIHKRNKQIEVPVRVHDYNVTMDGIDLADQQLAPHCVH